MMIKCAWCEFETENPEDAVVHMITSGHGLDAETQESFMDSGALAEMTQAIKAIQADPSIGTPVTEEEFDELPEDVKRRLQEGFEDD